MAALRPIDLRCEWLRQPLAIDVPRPRLSWRLPAPSPDRQTAYQIQVTRSLDALLAELPDLWDSGAVASSRCLDVPYDGPAFESTDQGHWRVRARIGVSWSEWSEPALWECGLIDRNRWHAQWISYPFEGDWTQAQPVQIVRKRFAIPPNTLRRARLYLSAKGLIRPIVNGHEMPAELLPGWTDYHRRIPYHVFDIDQCVQPGENEIVAFLGDGWYCGHVCWFGRNRYGSYPAALLRLSFEFEDAPPLLVGSDASWEAAESWITSSDLVMGERIGPGSMDDRCWVPARAMPLGNDRLCAALCEPAAIAEELEPVSITESPDGHTLVDFGQNHAGRLRLDVHSGTEPVTIRHAEVLQSDGRIYTENLRRAEATDKAPGPGIHRFPFTFHGYRYAEIEGVTPQQLGKVVSEVVHSELERTGFFECSDARLNRLVENAVWSMRSNFIEVPTDCPQRDERLGWLGDAQVFAPTACYLYNVAAFFTKWMRDVNDAVSDDGIFPNVAPQLEELGEGAPGWADAGLIVPWTMWRFYADEGLIQKCVPFMERHLTTLHDANPSGLWEHRRSHDFGDWLSIGEECDKLLLASAYLYRSTHILTEAIIPCSRMEADTPWVARADHCRRAFLRRFASGDRLEPESQTAYALALAFNLDGGDGELRARWGERLVERIEMNDGLIASGFLGVSHLLPALTATGHGDVAYSLLLDDRYPSWLFSLNHGATTIWERWDGWTPETGFQDPGMNSFNHYAFGSVVEWLFGGVAGIRVLEGPLTVSLSPVVDRRLEWVRAEWNSRYGPYRSAWRWTDEDTFEWECEIPPNASADIVLPKLDGQWVWSQDGRNLDGNRLTSRIRPHGAYTFRANREPGMRRPT